MARSAVPGCLLACLLAFSICQGAVGHGFLQVPRSRNYIANRQGREYCHHCLSSGGPWVVQTNTPGGLFPRPTETVASSVRHTMCGEAVTTPASQRLYNPSPVPSLASLPVYAPGAEFDMTVQITAHHRGHFEFRLCDASKLSDPTTVTWACLDQHVLQRVSVAGEVSPVDVNHPERYYLEPECAPGYNKTIVMRYRMPAAVTCERCVLQWWWVTANSCNPPDYQTRSPQPAHVASGCQWWQSNLPVCSTAYPEEFWNCADVRIAGAAAPPQPAIGNTEPAKPAAPQPVAPTTQTTAPAPAPASTPALVAPAQPVGAGCAKLGWQCGGAGWAGPTCCEQGSCMAYIPDYSDCRTSCPPGWLCNQQQTTPPAQPVVPPTAPPAAPAPKASPVAPKAPPVAPKAPPAAPKAPPAVPKAPPAAPKAPPAAPKAPPAVPKAPPAVPKAPPAVPKAPPSGTQGGCAGLGYQCGGSGWTGSTCCSVGQCYAYISTYSQCRIDACPPGWLCNTEKSLMTQAVDWVTSLASL